MSQYNEDGHYNEYDHYNGLFKALLFIQNNLDEDMTLDSIAKEACLSPFHFHRLFKQFTGENVKSYIRRLRLENAAFRLQTKKERLIDIAFDCGFQTHETFSRAFKRRFGYLPSQYSNDSILVNEKYITHIEKIHFAGRRCLFKRYVGPYENSGTPEDDNSLWHQILSQSELLSKDIQQHELYGISYDDPSITNKKDIRYDACVGISDKNINGTFVQKLHAGIYIVARHKGPFKCLIDSYNYIIYRWLNLHNYIVDHQIYPFEQFHLCSNTIENRIDHISIFIPIKPLTKLLID